MTTLSHELTLAREVAMVSAQVVRGAAPTPTRVPVRRDVLPASLLLLGSALLAFVVQTGLLSWVEHARSQKIAYADLRRDLAAATVPTGQLDYRGKLVAPGTPLGYLTSTQLGLRREVFFEGTTSAVLERGPGHRRSTVLPGQPGIAVLYGRSSAYGGPFGKAADLKTGASLTFTTGQGTSSYRVVGRRHAGDPFIGPAAGKGILTLVTSEGPPFVPEDAVYVDAELTSSPMPVAAPVLTAANLSESENPLAGDPSAWPLLFLALQGLAVAGLVLAWAGARFGTLQSWLVGVPVVGLLLIVSSQQALRLMPNLL